MARRRSDEDFSSEVQAHLDLETDRLIEEGMAPDAARAAARKAFGNVARAQERFHESTRWIWIEQFAQDLRYAWRSMRQSPAFVVTAVLTLAAGLGLLTVVFTVFNAYVLRPLAVQHPERLYGIGWRGPDTGSQILYWRDFEDLRSRTDLFEAVIAEDTHLISSDGRMLAASSVSDNYFRDLNPRLLAGRGLGLGDTGQPVAVLGYQAWQRLFAGDRAALGRELTLEDGRVTIVGILGPEFGGLDEYPKDLWRPASPGERVPLQVVARLRPEVTPAQAEAALSVFASRFVESGKDPRAYRMALEPNGTATPLVFDTIAVMAPVFIAFGLVLLTACANVSNAMLARAISRQREIAVRLSLGASRSRIVRQLVTEGLLIAVLAGAAGLAVASWALRVGVVLLFDTAPPTLASLMRVPPMTFDARVFTFAFCVAAVTALAFALMPALRASRQPLTDALRGQRSGTAGGSRLRSALVVAQVTVSMLLVICALVLAGNFSKLARIDVGFTTANVYSINVRGDDNDVKTIAPALAADPRVAAVAVTSGNPLFGRGRLVAASPAEGRSPVATRTTFASPEYFTILQMPMTRGRAFRPDEAESAAPVAIVSDSTARAFWPGVDPVGRTISLGPTDDTPADRLKGYTQVTVIGTTKDVLSGLIVDGRDAGHIYLPAAASHPWVGALLIRARAASDFRADMLRPTFRRLGYDPEKFEIIGLAEMRDIQMYPVRAAAWIGGLLGLIAVSLSVSGLYGVLSYLLAQRTREIGIRMALGATVTTVIRLVMGQCARLAGMGAVVGLLLGFAAFKWLSAVITLPEVSLLSIAPFATAVVIVLSAAALAAYQPARRATRVDPAETLRAEA